MSMKYEEEDCNCDGSWTRIGLHSFLRGLSVSRTGVSFDPISCLCATTNHRSTSSFEFLWSWKLVVWQSWTLLFHCLALLFMGIGPSGHAPPAQSNDYNSGCGV
jgi:hypothetical protein